MFLKISVKVEVQVRRRIRTGINNIEFRIRVRRKVSDPCGSRSIKLHLIAKNIFKKKRLSWITGICSTGTGT
jgi:hypothetical protein